MPKDAIFVSTIIIERSYNHFILTVVRLKPRNAYHKMQTGDNKFVNGVQHVLVSDEIFETCYNVLDDEGEERFQLMPIYLSHVYHQHSLLQLLRVLFEVELWALLQTVQHSNPDNMEMRSRLQWINMPVSWTIDRNPIYPNAHVTFLLLFSIVCFLKMLEI